MVEGKGRGWNAEEFREPDGFRLVERVWVGRRSQWFKAEQIRLGRFVAVKYLRPFLADSLPFRESFFEAGRQAALIVHPAALPVINVFTGHDCMAVQWAPGKSLKELGCAFESRTAALVGETVMDCLSSLHATGRCHGDIAPGNVFYDGERVWMDDFFQPPLLLDGDIAFSGEPVFISPEVMSGAAGDWRSDVFSLGRLIASSLRPETATGELKTLLAIMQTENPDKRGDSPAMIREAFQRIRRLEAAKQGEAPARAKRMYRRVPADFDVSLRKRSATPVETAAILMRTRDIGESGVFVETDDDGLVVGSIVELDFTLRGVEGDIHAFGIVRWRSVPPQPRGVGVQFVEVDQAGLARLRRFLGRKQ